MFLRRGASSAAMTPEKQWHRVENGMPWAYTELHSYSHEWHFLPGRFAADGALRRQRFSRRVGNEEKMNPKRPHFAQRRRWRKLAHRGPGV